VKDIQLFNGDGFNIKPGCSLNFSCCTCGLVHNMTFDIRDDGNISLVLEADDEATNKQRRDRNIAID